MFNRFTVLAVLAGSCITVPAISQEDDDESLDEVVTWGRAVDLVGAADSASQGLVGYDDLSTRPLLRVGELVEVIPGMIATQHSGGGKANQYFLRGINLDHIGGNAEKDITEKKYLQHLEMFKSKIGYPLVSVLPHHISQKCVDKTGDYLWDYEKGPRNIISDYYS